jgi:hypothetical protein
MFASKFISDVEAALCEEGEEIFWGSFWCVESIF